VLGDEAYESLARTGRGTTNAELSDYALDQIDGAREFLERKETQEPPESL
jgi:hypothetical protein